MAFEFQFRGFEVGDKVYILCNSINALKYRVNRSGKITNIDGHYILVKPSWCDWEIELYSNEICHLEEIISPAIAERRKKRKRELQRRDYHKYRKDPVKVEKIRANGRAAYYRLVAKDRESYNKQRREYMRKYYQKHPEKKSVVNARYHEKNRHAINMYVSIVNYAKKDGMWK